MPPPSLEQFSYKNAKLPPEELGELRDEEISCEDLIATRPFLIVDRSKEHKRRRSSKPKPEVIDYNGDKFLIDGHHKTKKAIERGEGLIEARILRTTNERIGKKLKRINNGPISDLPIRE